MAFNQTLSAVRARNQALFDEALVERGYGVRGGLRTARRWIEDINSRVASAASPYIPAVRQAIADYVIPSLGTAAAFTAAGYIPYRHRFLRRVGYGIASRLAYRNFRQPWIQRSFGTPWKRRTFYRQRRRRGFRPFRRNTRPYIERFLGGVRPNV